MALFMISQFWFFKLLILIGIHTSDISCFLNYYEDSKSYKSHKLKLKKYVDNND